MRFIALPLCLCVFVCCFIASSLTIRENRKDLGAHYSLAVGHFPAEAVKILAGEFNGLMADYLLLEIGSFVGSNRKISKSQWENVRLGFEQAMQLDPYFQQTYLMAQAFLTWDAKMPSDAIRLLDISRRHRSWDWRPGYYMGFDYYYFLNDYKKASEIFLDTAKIKSAPLIIALLGARFAVKSERTEASIQMLGHMLKDPELHDDYKKKIEDRIVVLKGVLLLERAIEGYKARFSGYPPSLEALVEKGILKKLPVNPYSKAYIYDRNKGSVSFD